MEIINYLLTGASAAAVIKLIDNLIQWRLKRKAEKEDKSEAEEEAKQEEDSKKRKQMEQSVEALRDAMKFVLLDRIQHLGRAYLRDGEVDFDDRRRLHEMHSVYHNQLGGNGDLDVLMDLVNELPLKTEGS